MGIFDKIKRRLEKKEDLLLTEAITSEDRSEYEELIYRIRNGRDASGIEGISSVERRLDDKKIIKEILLKSGLDQRFEQSEYAMDEACDICRQLITDKFGDGFSIFELDKDNIAQFVSLVKSAVNDKGQIGVYVSEDMPVVPKLKKGQLHSFKGADSRFKLIYRGISFSEEDGKDYLIKSTVEQKGNIINVKKREDDTLVYERKYNSRSVTEKVTLDGVVLSTQDELDSVEKTSISNSCRNLHSVTTTRMTTIDPDLFAVNAIVRDVEREETLRQSGDRAIARAGCFLDAHFTIRNSPHTQIEEIGIPYTTEQICAMTREHKFTRVVTSPDRMVESDLHRVHKQYIQEWLNDGVADYSKVTEDESITNKQKEQTILRVLSANKGKETLEQMAMNSGYCTHDDIDVLRGIDLNEKRFNDLKALCEPYTRTKTEELSPVTYKENVQEHKNKLNEDIEIV